jgi:hypothetical protein
MFIYYEVVLYAAYQFFIMHFKNFYGAYLCRKKFWYECTEVIIMFKRKDLKLINCIDAYLNAMLCMTIKVS